MRRRRRQSAIPSSVTLPRRWRQGVLITVIVALVGIGVVCERSSRRVEPGDDQSRYHDRTFRVARVVDGDTLDIAVADGGKPVTRIRLWGVDAPESHPGQTMHFGAEATAFARRTLGDRLVHVVLSPTRTRGKYGRLLAYVYLERGGTMFNEMLLEEGCAYADYRFDHHYYNQFKALEKQARRDERGLWAEITPEQMPEWRRRYETRSAGKGQ